MITVGITTCNRLSILERVAQSFYASRLLYPYKIKIYDDASKEYDVTVLKQVFPDATSIHRHKNNIGADANMLYMYKDFLESTDDEIFFNADSDLIFSSEWMEKGVEALKKSDGVLSIYNTPHHSITRETEFFLEKDNLGAAGTFFSRRALQCLFDNMNEDRLSSLASVGADFGWSKFFRAHGFHLYTTKESFVQHIGFSGYNGTLDKINFGKNFTVDSTINGQILNDTLYDVTVMQTQSVRRSYSLFPFKFVPRGAKVVLYGYGNTGKDFFEQIKRSEYCELVAIIDTKKFDDDFVCQPQALTMLNFDYLVLATLYDDVADSMKRVAKSILPDIESKIIYKESNALIRL